MLKPKSYLEYLESVALSAIHGGAINGEILIVDRKASSSLRGFKVSVSNLEEEVQAQRTRRAEEKKPRFGIGTTFVPNGGRHARPEHTVIGIHTTTDHNGNVISIKYETEHWFAGQKIRTVGVVETTIAIGLVTATPPP